MDRFDGPFPSPGRTETGGRNLLKEQQKLSLSIVCIYEYHWSISIQNHIYISNTLENAGNWHENAFRTHEFARDGYSKPKPEEFSIAPNNISAVFALLAYSGNNKVLKQVALVGKRLESGPFRCNLKGGSKFFKPPVGALDAAVTKRKNLHFCSSLNACTMLQNSTTDG